MSLRTVAVILLSLQLPLLGSYKWNEDYLTRSTPIYQPYTGNEGILSWKFWYVTADNACMRSKHHDPKNPSVSRKKKWRILTSGNVFHNI